MTKCAQSLGEEIANSVSHGVALLAAIGILLKALDRLSYPWLSTGLYLVMGWLSLIAVMGYAA